MKLELVRVHKVSSNL